MTIIKADREWLWKAHLYLFTVGIFLCAGYPFFLAK